MKLMKENCESVKIIWVTLLQPFFKKKMPNLQIMVSRRKQKENAQQSVKVWMIVPWRLVQQKNVPVWNNKWEAAQLKVVSKCDSHSTLFSQQQLGKKNDKWLIRRMYIQHILITTGIS